MENKSQEQSQIKISDKELLSIINFVGKFPKETDLNTESFEKRESYWTGVVKKINIAVEQNSLSKNQANEILGNLIAVKEWLSDHDALTGLSNRRAIEDNLGKEITSAERYSYPLSILVADVDGLKVWNDQDESHHSGDKAIIGTADAIQAGVRKTDFTGRWAGDEFLVILPHSDKGIATEVAQRILDEVKKIPPISNKNLSISIGIGQWQQNERLDDFFGKVDAAVYQAKKTENKFVVAND